DGGRGRRDSGGDSESRWGLFLPAFGELVQQPVASLRKVDEAQVVEDRGPIVVDQLKLCERLFPVQGEIAASSDRLGETARLDLLDQQRIERPCEVGGETKAFGATLAANQRCQLQQPFGRVDCRRQGLVDAIEGAAD